MPFPNRVRWLLLLLAWLQLPVALQAQATAPREELLRLVPDDFGLCFVVNDLRGHHEKWQRTDWLRAFAASPPGQTLLNAPELKELARLEEELKRHLDIDWPTLRDDILGEALLFAYRPASADRPEQGLILLHARQPKTLAALLDRLNEVQKSNGELKSLAAVDYRGTTYQRRVHIRDTHYYYLKNGLLAVAGSEELLRQVVDRGLASSDSPWPGRFRNAKADQALAALCVNPRAFDAELLPDKQAAARSPGLAMFWRALDAAFLTAHAGEELELRLTLQARTQDMPGWAGSLFSGSLAPSRLWDRFPEPAILTLAARNDFAALADRLLELMPAKDREKLTEDLRRATGGLSMLDVFQDIVPNLGPDWGLCVLPPTANQATPHVLAALAVRPGSKAEKVDETLLKGINLLATLTVLDHNRKAEQPVLRLQTVQRQGVEVSYLSGEQVFPAGVSPAWALKDGFLLLASAPEIIDQFRPQGRKETAQDEVPLLRLSLVELNRLLTDRRGQVAANLKQRENLSQAEAEQKLDNLQALLGLFEHVILTQSSAPGQASWTLRAQPLLVRNQ